MLCILLVFSLSACGGNVNEVNTHNVESEIYSEEDIAAAIDTIKKEFKSNWNGCTLTKPCIGEEFAGIGFAAPAV